MRPIIAFGSQGAITASESPGLNALRRKLGLALQVWPPESWQLELRRDPQGELAQVVLRQGAMGFSRIPERKSASHMHFEGSGFNQVLELLDCFAVDCRVVSALPHLGGDLWLWHHTAWKSSPAASTHWMPTRGPLHRRQR